MTSLTETLSRLRAGMREWDADIARGTIRDCGDRMGMPPKSYAELSKGFTRVTDAPIDRLLKALEIADAALACECAPEPCGFQRARAEILAILEDV